MRLNRNLLLRQMKNPPKKWLPRTTTITIRTTEPKRNNLKRIRESRRRNKCCKRCSRGSYSYSRTNRLVSLQSRDRVCLRIHRRSSKELGSVAATGVTKDQMGGLGSVASAPCAVKKIPIARHFCLGNTMRRA